MGQAVAAATPSTSALAVGGNDRPWPERIGPVMEVLGWLSVGRPSGSQVLTSVQRITRSGDLVLITGGWPSDPATVVSRRSSDLGDPMPPTIGGGLAYSPDLIR